MTSKQNSWLRRQRFEPYWFLIIPLLLGVSLLYINHLRTGATPSRVFLHIAVVDFDVYWYGICIVGGIALGAYVVSRLLLDKARATLDIHVPAAIQTKPISKLGLPSEIEKILKKNKVNTLGQLLLRWGFDPRSLGLNKEGSTVLLKKLEQSTDIEESWLLDAPWRGWNPDHVWNGIAWCLVLGLIGARLYHVLTPSPSMAALGIRTPLDYFRNPEQMINIRNGGLGIYGAIAGGMLGLFWYTRRNRLPTVAWMDLAAVGMALGQVFGRWGNFFNQELYGGPTALPWGLRVDLPIAGFDADTRFHPAFLYESLWSLLTFAVLLTLVRRFPSKLKSGDLVALYLVFYATGRTLLETVRLDSRMVTIGDTTFNMAVATLVSIIVAVLMILWRVLARQLAKGD